MSKEKPCIQNSKISITRKNGLNAQTCVNYQNKNGTSSHSETKIWMNVIYIFLDIFLLNLSFPFSLIFYFLLLKYIRFRNNVYVFVRYGDKGLQFILDSFSCIYYTIFVDKVYMVDLIAHPKQILRGF